MERVGGGVVLALIALSGCSKSEAPSGPARGGTGGQAGGDGGSGASSTGGTASLDVARVLDGYVMKQPCLEDSGPRSCRTHPPGPCPVDPDPLRAGARPTDETLSFGGRAGVLYDVTMRVQGIVESKPYRGGADVSDLPTHGFHRSGTVDHSTNQRSAFAMRVIAPTGDYFFNSLGQEALGRGTVAVDYEATITISGGTPVEMRVVDPNCQALKNCLPDEPDAECVPGEIPDIEPKIREGLGSEPRAFDGQFLGFAVKDVRERG